MSFEQRARLVLLGSIVLSVLVHGAASVALALLPSTIELALAMERSIVDFEVEEAQVPVEPEPEPVGEAELPTPEPEEPVVPETPPAPRDPNTPPPRETPEPAAPLAEQVHDFGGEVLTGTGAGWATQQGSGQDTRGPIGNPVARTTGRDVAGSASGAVDGTGTAPAAPAPPANYSRRPSPPPGMGARLERNYPTGARARSVEGRASVAFRVLADGSIEVQRVVSESPAGEGFGQACMETLRGTSWTTALDESGNAVAITPRPYSCTFRLRR